MKYEDVVNFISDITAKMDEFSKDTKSGDNIYLDDIDYLKGCINFHKDNEIISLYLYLNDLIGSSTVIDVGCETGITGLLLSGEGKTVTFYDFDNIGLKFIEWYSKKNNLPYNIVKYDEVVGKHDWVISLDVLEHCGNPLSFLRWLEYLGTNIVITYPITVKWQPPYLEDRIDEWVDDEAVRLVIGSRYDVKIDKLENGRRFIYYKVK